MNRFREHGIALGMALAFVGMGLVGIVGAWGAYLTDIRIERHGARAEGQLLAKRIAASADGDADHRVRYRFTPAEGPAIDRELGVGKRLWDSLHEGQVIEVRYSSASPKRNFPAGAGVPRWPRHSSRSWPDASPSADSCSLAACAGCGRRPEAAAVRMCSKETHRRAATTRDGHIPTELGMNGHCLCGSIEIIAPDQETVACTLFDAGAGREDQCLPCIAAARCASPAPTR